jgi:hypothetical protein
MPCAGPIPTPRVSSRLAVPLESAINPNLRLSSDEGSTVALQNCSVASVLLKPAHDHVAALRVELAQARRSIINPARGEPRSSIFRTWDQAPARGTWSRCGLSSRMISAATR